MGSGKQFEVVQKDIEPCDVVSIDNHLLQEKEVRGFENRIKEHYASGNTTEAFLSRQIRASTGFGYHLALFKYILDHTIAVVQAERHSDAPDFDLAVFRESLMVDHGFKGIPDFLEYSLHLWRSAEEYNATHVFRDKNIGKNVPDVVVDRIEELYPELQGKELHYVILTGVENSPQTYIRPEPETQLMFINLTAEERDPFTCIHRIQREGGDKEEAIRYMVRVYAFGLIPQILIGVSTAKKKKLHYDLMQLHPGRGADSSIVETVHSLGNALQEEGNKLTEKHKKLLATYLVKHGVEHLLGRDIKQEFLSS